MHMGHGTLAGSRSGAALPVHRPASSRVAPSRRPVPTKAGLLDFLNPASTKGGGTKRGRAGEIVDELFQLTAGTEGGIKASPSLKKEVEQLVSELEGYCPRAPLRSELIFGEWEVVFASKPQTAGGPFRSPLGRAVFPGQRATQTIAPPNVCTNEVSYRTLGFLPGAARQEGEIEPIDETTFTLVFPGLDGKRPGGPPRRVIQTAYLDERMRVARFVPEEDAKEEGSFYVFRRVAAAGGDDEEEEEEEEEEAPTPAPQRKSPMAAFGTQIFKRPGAATQAERSYKASGGSQSQRAQQQRPAKGGTAQKRAGTGTVRKGTQQDPAAARAAAKAAAEQERERAREQAVAAKAAAEQERARAREQAATAKAEAEEERARAREQAVAAKAKAEEERRRAQVAAEADRAAQAQRRAEAREQYEELAGEAAEAANEARAAVAAAKAADRESAALLRQAAQARGIIERAQSAAQGATEQFAGVQAEEVAAEQAVLGLQRAVDKLEAQLRRQSELVGPRLK